jgi:hypothetical protein
MKNSFLNRRFSTEEVNDCIKHINKESSELIAILKKDQVPGIDTCVINKLELNISIARLKSVLKSTKHMKKIKT